MTVRAERGEAALPCGVLVLDKGPGPSSFDLVRRVRQALQIRRVGHGGTLDGMASGVLPICLGEATKLAQFLLDADKEYDATVCLGVETDTGDAEGRSVSSAPAESLALVDESRVRAALDPFRGEILQVPPLYSALKHKGRPLYSYARAGQHIDREPRRVRIDELELTGWGGPHAVQLHVRCSKGTYIRSLAADIGRALGCGGHLTSLRRTRSGPFSLAAALPIDRVLELCRDGAALPLVRPADVLAHLPAVTLDQLREDAVRQGKRVPVEATADMRTGDSLRLLRVDGTLVAVAELLDGGLAAPVRVWHAG